MTKRRIFVIDNTLFFLKDLKKIGGEEIMDEDFICEPCLGEAIIRRFLYYPYHQVCRVMKRVPEGVTSCTICGEKTAKFTVSIVMSSIDVQKMNADRQRNETIPDTRKSQTGI